MEHFNSILFPKSGPANEEHTYQAISLYSSLRARAYQPTPGLNYTCPQIEVIDLPGSLKLKCGQDCIKKSWL